MNYPARRRGNTNNQSGPINSNASQYEPVSQSDPDRTRDDFLEEQDRINERQKEFSRTNLFKSRIIHTEINSSLIFQTVLYFHYFYTVICFLIQVFSNSFKLWVFIPNNISIVRIALTPCYLIFQLIRLSIGYKANIEEKFPDFIFFKIFTVVFIPPCELIQLVGNQVLPIDYATVIIEMLFLILEFILSIRAMINVTRRQGAVYYLRNTQTTIITEGADMKSSAEIEEELFYNFPHLRKGNENNKSREKIN